MKNLTITQKDEIRNALSVYCDNYPTRNRACETLKDVSAATVSFLLNNKYENISDEMFRRIAQQIGYNLEYWAITENGANRGMQFAMSDAQLYKNVTWLVGDAGCGKTTTALEYRRTHRNVFYVLCSEDMRKGDFVCEIAKQVGASTDSSNLRDILAEAISMIAYLDNPVIIFDEGDKLTDTVFNYFISIYNRLEGHSGIVFMSTDFIKRRMENGLKYNKKGYKEIWSRIGRRFFFTQDINANDIYSICVANGIESQSDINKITKEAQSCGYDLRRVKRQIHACRRINEAKKGGK